MWSGQCRYFAKKENQRQIQIYGNWKPQQSKEMMLSVRVSYLINNGYWDLLVKEDPITDG